MLKQLMVIYNTTEHGTIIKTDNGIIQLFIPNRINADLEINSQTGKILIENDLNIYFSDNSINYKKGIIGTGGNKISINTKNGSITLLKK